MRKILAAIAAVIFAAALLTTFQKGSDDESEYYADTAEQTRQSAPEESPAENATRQITITACGDCTLARDAAFDFDGSFDDYAGSKGLDYFFEKVRDIFESDDLTIINFEGTLSSRGERQDKTFAFRGDPSYINAVSSSSIEAANLANNHSRDYGEVSLEDTKKYLSDAGILNFEGMNTCLAEINGIQVGLVGINALNETEADKLENAVTQVRNEGAELVLLSVHWGIEKDTEPSADQISLAHKAIDCGADLVIGTHPHVLQGIEKYNGRYILYSLGNFCFGGNSNPSDKDTAIWRQTFTLKGTEVQDDDNYEIIPCRVSGADGYNNYQPVPAEGDQKANIEDRLQSYSEELGDIELNFV